MATEIVVKKFGGAALKSLASVKHIAKIVAEDYHRGQSVCVVVSAMGDTTDELLETIREANAEAPRREVDLLVSCGETMSAALFAICLADLGVESVSFTGLQAGIITTAEHSRAEVTTVAAHAVAAAMYAGKVAVIAGFQGCTLEGEITTLGRGGSDLTAVLMAEALGAKVAEFYKDVDGMYDADPSSESAKLMREVDYSQALEIISRSKHQVIQDRALLYAQRHRVTLRVLPFSERRRIGVGTYIRDYQLSPV